MSATIPIWCAVLNNILFDESIDEGLLAPPWMPLLQASALAEGTRRIMTDMKESTRNLILVSLRSIVIRPLRIVWAAPVDGAIEWFGELAEALVCEPDSVRMKCTPLVLLSCSSDMSEDIHREQHSWGYVKGAGDDEEHWAEGLAANIFWRHAERILEGHTDDEVSRTVKDILSEEASASSGLSTAGVDMLGGHLNVHPIGNSGLYLCMPSGAVPYSLPDESFDSILSLHALSNPIQISISTRSDKIASVTEDIILHDDSEKGIKNNNWTEAISSALMFYKRLLTDRSDTSSSESSISCGPRVLVVCSGACFAHALAAVAIIVAYQTYNSEQALFHLRPDGVDSISKASIRLTVSVLQASCPFIRLPRALIKQLTTYFLSPTTTTSTPAAALCHWHVLVHWQLPLPRRQDENVDALHL